MAHPLGGIPMAFALLALLAVIAAASEPVPTPSEPDTDAAAAKIVPAEKEPDVSSEVDLDSEWDAVSDYPGAERQGAILQALSLGLNFTNVSRNDCVWRKLSEMDSLCPDEDVAVYLYTSVDTRIRINISEADALRKVGSGWDPEQHTVVLVHGYGSGADKVPNNILIQAYLEAGGYNVLVLDWWKLARLPCYPAAVHNSVVAARCVGGVARMLRDSGARGDSWTCVGHSLGAHVCGIMADTVMFRVHKIIGLDPARPLIRPQNKHRLDAGDATVVHVMHTNAGHYGELGAIGTADFCVNGGRVQPFCSAAKNPNLCSHVSSVCFLADSLDGRSPLVAEPCGRRCPSARRAQVAAHKLGMALPASLGQHTPDSASGTFCASRELEPYCQREPGQRGHPNCCPPRHSSSTSESTSSTTSTTEPSTSTETEVTTSSTVPTEDATPKTEDTTERFIVGAAIATETVQPSSATHPKASDSPALVADTHVTRGEVMMERPVDRPTRTPSSAEGPAEGPEIQSQLLITVPDFPVIRFPSDPDDVPPTGMIPPPPPPPPPPPATSLSPAPPLKWTPPSFSSPSNVHVVMASNDSSLFAGDAVEPPASEQNVFTVFSTKNPQSARPPPGPLVVVMANSDFNIKENLIESSSAPHHVGVPPRPFSPSAPVMDEAMVAMTEMGPPPLDTVHTSLPFASPSSSPPPLEPASPPDTSMIPAAGSPTGTWIPMVMLPPTPFSSDSWMLRYKVPRPLPMRRTTYRNYIYDK